MAQEMPYDPSTWAWTAADRLALKLIREVHTRERRIINGRQSQPLTLELPSAGSLLDILNGETYSGQTGEVTLEMRPLWGAVLQV